MIPIFFFCGVVIGLGSLISFSPYISVLCASLSVFLISLSILLHVFKVERKHHGYKYYLAFHVAQPLVFFVLTLNFRELTEIMCGNTDLFSGGYWSLWTGYLVVPVVSLFYAHRPSNMSRSRRFPRQDARTLSWYLNQVDDLFLIGCAMVSLLIWFVAAVPTFMGYGFRVLHGLLVYSPMVAGYLRGRNKAVDMVWYITLAAGLFFGLLTGSRGHALWPIVYYALGEFLRVNVKRRLLYIVLALLLIPTMIYAVGAWGYIRSETGRRQLRDINAAQTMQLIPEAFRKSKELTTDGYSLEKTNMYNGLERLVDWTMLFVPNMSPTPVKYRGYWDYNDELMGMFAFAGGDLRSVFGRYYASVLFARNYGFNVYLSTTEEGSLKSYTVPFSIVADAWSRGGFLSAAAQVWVLFLILSAFENFMHRRARAHSLFASMGMCYLIGFALKFATVYNLTRSVRSLLVYMTALFVVTEIYHRLFAQNLSQMKVVRRPPAQRYA